MVFGLKGLEESVEGVLGGGVGTAHGEAEASGYAGGDGDLSAALCDHTGKDALGEHDGGVEVDVHDLADDVDVGFDGGAALADACVVEEDVDVAEKLPCLAGEGVYAVEVAEVEGEGRGVCGSKDLALVGDLLQLMGIASCEDEGGAFLGEFVGGSLADAGRGSRNPDYFV